MLRLALVLFLLTLIPGATRAEGLPAPDVKPLANATEVTVYSLAGEEARSKPKTESMLHGYQVLGQSKLTGAEAKRVADIVSTAIRSGHGISQCMFNPHHAVSVVSGGHTYDYLISQCDVLLFDGDKAIGMIGGIEGTPNALDALLTAAHVPLAPIYDKDADDAAYALQLSKVIQNIQTGKTAQARTDAAQRLADITHDTNHSFSHETITEITALLDSPDDSVRYWVAMCLGNIGPAAATTAVHKLKEALTQADCQQGEKTSASGIRYALNAMGVTPPAPKCGAQQ